MNKQIENKTETTQNTKNSNANVEVLYQKMGNRWFAFSVVNDDVFIGSITQEEIDALEARETANTFAINGNT
jgi:hypothetical protein